MATAAGMRTAAGTHTAVYSRKFFGKCRGYCNGATATSMATATATAAAMGMAMSQIYVRAGGEQRKGIWVLRSGSLVCAIGIALNACWGPRARTCRKELIRAMGSMGRETRCKWACQRDHIMQWEVSVPLDRRRVHSNAAGPRWGLHHEQESRVSHAG